MGWFRGKNRVRTMFLDRNVVPDSTNDVDPHVLFDKIMMTT